MKAYIVISAEVETGNASLRAAQWIAEEIRDWALRTLGVTDARVEEVRPLPSLGEGS